MVKAMTIPDQEYIDEIDRAMHSGGYHIDAVDIVLPDGPSSVMLTERATGKVTSAAVPLAAAMHAKIRWFDKNP
jgi:hypothetical protein